MKKIVLTSAEPYRYEDCRDIRHAWERQSDEITLETGKGGVLEFVRVLACDRCDTVRFDKYRVRARNGVVYVTREGARYRYPSDYRVPGGLNVERMRGDMLLRHTDLVGQVAAAV